VRGPYRKPVRHREVGQVSDLLISPC
jgi:hypothetical protein